MTTSQQNTFLSEILTGQPIPVGKLAYFRARLSNRIHELVLEEYMRLEREKGFTRAELARRIGREPAQVTRWLGAAGNWTIDTFSDLLLGMGCEPSLSAINLTDNPVATVLPRKTASEPSRSAQSNAPEKISTGSAMQHAGDEPMARGRLGSMYEALEPMGMQA